MIQCTTISISVCLSKFIYFNGFITAFKFANLFYSSPFLTACIVGTKIPFNRPFIKV